MTVDLGLWHKVPTYAEVVQAIDKDYKVKLPARTSLQVWDSFAMSQYKEQVAELQNSELARHDHNNMQAAMQEAADEQGITRNELNTFMTHMAAQSSSAARDLQRQLNESSQAQQRAMAEQGAQFAQALAQQSQQADRREAAAELARQALQAAPQTAASVPPGDPGAMSQRSERTAPLTAG